MLPLAINGIGPVGAFGAGAENWRKALEGRLKIEPEITSVKTRAGICELPVFRASSQPLADFVKPRKLRRLDNFSRLALLGSLLAVADSGSTLNGSRTGLIVASAHGASATTFAFLDSVIDDGDALASPTLFSNSVHNAAASHIAEHLKITGPTLSLAQGRDSLTMAMLTAAQWLEQRSVDTVLCGVCDCYCEVLGYCWQSCREAFAKAVTPPATGPGEGTLFLRLSRTEKNSPQPKHGYINQIELNCAAPPANRLQISTRSGCMNQKSPNSDSESDSDKNQLKLNLSAICGDLPVPTSFDLAAAVTLLQNQHLFDRYLQRETAGGGPVPETAICCWQPHAKSQQKSLTGNCYWVTNHPATK